MATISTAKDKSNGREYSIQELKKLKNKYPDEFELLKENLVCYECSLPKMIARLGKVNEHHFATASNQKHEFDCYYFGNEYTQQEVGEIVDEVDNSSVNKPTANQVQSAFEQILAYLNREKSSLATPVTKEAKNGHMKENSPVSKDNDQIKKSKYIPRKKLNKEISDEDIDVWKIYYGRVKVRSSKSTEYFHNFIVSAFSEKEVEYRISVGILKDKLEECDTKTKDIIGQIIKKPQEVNLMVLGKISKYKQYNNITVTSASLLRLTP